MWLRFFHDELVFSFKDHIMILMSLGEARILFPEITMPESAFETFHQQVLDVPIISFFNIVSAVVRDVIRDYFYYTPWNVIARNIQFPWKYRFTVAIKWKMKNWKLSVIGFCFVSCLPRMKNKREKNRRKKILCWLGLYCDGRKKYWQLP